MKFYGLIEIMHKLHWRLIYNDLSRVINDCNEKPMEQHWNRFSNIWKAFEKNTITSVSWRETKKKRVCWDTSN